MKANSKKLLSLLMAVAMVLSLVPAISLQAEAAFDATNTICDACGVAPEGGWTAVTSTSQISAAGHYYLSGDLTTTSKSGFNFAVSGGTACLNLNGATLDNTTSGSSYRTLSCTAGTLNVMGSGTVKSANGSKTGSGGAIYAAGGTINLYGGTYTGVKDCTVLAALSNGTLNVYNATVTLGTIGISSGSDSVINIYDGTLPCAIRCGSAVGTVNIYGGDFSGSSRGIVYSQAPATLTITGGTFSADPSSYVPGVSCYSIANNTVSASHTKADGDEGTVIVAGSCTVDRMVEYTCSVEGCGAKFTEVTEATGHDFGSNNATCANCGAANPDYVGLPSVCPGCGETVTEWKPVTAATGTSDWTMGSGHFYLANDLTGGGKRVMQFIADTEVCLHLNGHSITSTYTGGSGITVRSYGTLRLMGEGTISAGEDTAAMGAVVAYSGTVEIYGGTYVDSTSKAPVRENGGTIKVYGGTFCDNPGSYVQEGYEATENQDGTWTVAAVAGPELPTTCPCGATGLTADDWTELTSAGISTGATTHNHYYVAEDTTISGTGNSIQLGANQCIYLMAGATLTNNGRIRARGGFDLHVFGEGNYVRPNSESEYGMFEGSSSNAIYIHGGNWTYNDPDVAVVSGSIIVDGGSFNFDPSAYVVEGYRATEENGIWTVAEYTAPPLPETCPMCGEPVAEWTEVTAATGDTGFAATGHYALANNISGGSKRVFRVLEGTEICLYLNGYNITGTSALNGAQAFQVYGTLRIAGEGTVSTPNVVVPEGDTGDWGTVAANEGAVVEIYGGTYIDSASRGNALRSTGTITVYDGVFSNEVTGFVADNKWCLPKDDMWHVEDLTAAAVVTESGYTTYETTEAAVAAYTEGYILMGSADSIELTKAAVVDSNDKENVVVTGEGVLSPVGGGSWDLTNANVNRDATNPVTGVRYLTVENNTYKFDMKISKVVLRPGTTSEDLGIYYKTKITVGDDLVNLIDSYGVALSLFDMPTAEDILAVGSHALYTVVDNNLVAGENTVTSGLLNNILKKECTADELETAEVANIAEYNSKRGEMSVYANAYIAIDLDGDDNEEIIMANVEYNGIEHSLKGIMGKVDAMASIPQAAIDCYKAWAPVGMDQWALTNLAVAAAE